MSLTLWGHKACDRRDEWSGCHSLNQLHEGVLPPVAKVLLIVGTVEFLYKKKKVLTFNVMCLEIMYIMIWRYTNKIELKT